MITRQIGPEERHLLMQEWSSTIHYWATDNSILWQRCSIFLIVNSLLFTGVALTHPDTFLATWILKYGIPILAFFINILWLLVNLRSVACIRHYEQRCQEIRDVIPLLRFYDPNQRKSQFHHWWEKLEGKKHILLILPFLFLVFWVVVLIWNLSDCAL